MAATCLELSAFLRLSTLLLRHGYVACKSQHNFADVCQECLLSLWLEDPKKCKEQAPKTPNDILDNSCAPRIFLLRASLPPPHACHGDGLQGRISGFQVAWECAGESSCPVLPCHDYEVASIPG